MREYLTSATIVGDVENVISHLFSEGGEVSASLVDRIRRSHGNAEQAQILIELALGTSKARSMGKYRPGWLFTRRMAEQATHPVIAAYHAERFAECRHVVEICTGAGMDAFALSAVVPHVTTYEADETTHAIVAGNVQRSGIASIDLRCQPWPSPLDLSYDGVWADPSRRSERRRLRVADAYEPPLSSIPTNVLCGMKIGPGDELSPDAEREFTSEYIGFADECRERILWSAEAGLRPLVTLLDGSGTRDSWTPQGTAEAQIVRNGGFLIEPHNAVIASGSVGAFFVEKGAGVLDPRIGYGIVDEEPPASLWYRAYRVEAMEPGTSVRRMQDAVRLRGWGSGTVIKKRGWDQDPEQVRRKLTFAEGGQPGVIIVARVGSGHVTIYATACEVRRGSRSEA
ncbi:MAG: hypothetical protein FGM32_00010 [Candidatus Kapabacteria bacterium]|nr:hypothetical protein [Candidatus Kapabacteria bacterium]